MDIQLFLKNFLEQLGEKSRIPGRYFLVVIEG